MKGPVEQLYTPTYMVGVNVLTLYSLYQLWCCGFDLAWSGVFLASLPVAIFLDHYLMNRHRRRNTRNMPVISMLVLLGILLTLVGWTNQPDARALQLILGGAVFLGWLVYDIWYSRNSRYGNGLSAG